MRLLQQVIHADGFNGHAWHSLGALDEEQGQLDAAQKCYANGQRSGGARRCRQCILYTRAGLMVGAADT